MELIRAGDHRPWSFTCAIDVYTQKILLPTVTDKLSAMPLWHCAVFSLLMCIASHKQPTSRSGELVDEESLSLFISFSGVTHNKKASLQRTRKSLTYSSHPIRVHLPYIDHIFFITYIVLGCSADALWAQPTVLSFKVSTSLACAESWENGSAMAWMPWLVSPFATPMRFLESRRIGSPAWRRSSSLI